MSMTNKEIREQNLRQLIIESGLSQSAFALRIETNPAYLSQIFSKSSKRSIGDQMARKIEHALNLPKGWMDSLHSPDAYKILPPVVITTSDFPGAKYISMMELCYDSDRLTENDVLLELINGHTPEVRKLLQPSEDAITKLRVSRKQLESMSINIDFAFGMIVVGNSMAPLLPESSIVVLNGQITEVKDGDIYAVSYAEQMRVNMLYHAFGGGYRLRSFNHDEWPDEIIGTDQTHKIKILGRVFCWSVLR